MSEQGGERGAEALLRLKRARDELRRQKERLEREIAERRRVERELQKSLDFTSRAMIHRQPLDLGALAE